MTSIGQKNVTQQMSSWKSPYRLISACKPRSASNSSTSRYESEKRRYQPTARRITCGSNCRHLNRSQTEDARRSIRPAYHGGDCKVATLPSGVRRAPGPVCCTASFLVCLESLSDSFSYRTHLPFDSKVATLPHRRQRGGPSGGVLSFHGLFQCKRYKGSVSPSIIRDFRGALIGRADKGWLLRLC